MKLPQEEFALLCYLILMQNGIIDKHPDYIKEKTHLLNAGYEAYGALDIHNMRMVNVWHEKWKVEMPEGPADYLKRSEEAVKELQERGVEI